MGRKSDTRQRAHRGLRSALAAPVRAAQVLRNLHSSAENLSLAALYALRAALLWVLKHVDEVIAQRRCHEEHANHEDTSRPGDAGDDSELRLREGR